jgi:hypothetical protein
LTIAPVSLKHILHPQKKEKNNHFHLHHPSSLSSVFLKFFFKKTHLFPFFVLITNRKT